MISPDQARAARAMLNWKQAELAAAAHVSVTAVNYFEREIGATRTDTINRLRGAFEDAGIEFLPGGGLRRKEESFQFLNHQGPDFIAKLNEDFYRAMRKGDAEVLQCSVNEENWELYGSEANKEYQQFVKRYKIRERILVPEGKPHLNAPRQSYRALPHALIGKIAYLIYADRVAYILWPQKRVVIMRSADLAATVRGQFDFLWNQGQPV